MSYEAIQKKIDAGLKRAGRRTGKGPVAARLVKGSTGGAPGQWGGDGTENEAGGPFDMTVLILNYTTRDREGTNISAKDMKLLVSPKTDGVPSNGDTIEIVSTGEVFSVVNVDPLQPGAEVLMWTVQGRRGG